MKEPTISGLLRGGGKAGEVGGGGGEEEGLRVKLYPSLNVAEQG